MNTRVQPIDFYEYLQKQGQKNITSLSQWKKYIRRYMSKAGILENNSQLTDAAKRGYFWFGIPENLRQIFEVKLQARNPTFDTAKPWPIDDVQNVAEAHFKCNKFADELFHLPALGIRRTYEEDDDDEDDYNDSDSEEDDYEEECRRRRKRPTKKKPKPRDRSFRVEPPVQTMREEPSRRIVPPPEDSGIEKIIHQLNTMSLEDPQYGALYYKAVKNDRGGLVAQCINRKPKQDSNNRVTREPPPHQGQAPVRPPYSRGLLPYFENFTPKDTGPMKCYGCSGQGHSLKHCLKMANMVYKGLVSLDANLKYRLPDGQLILRQQDENLIEAIERLTPSKNQVQFTTLGNAVESFYNQSSK
jgi:hypothetical protein